MTRYYAGVDVGGSHVSVGLLDEAGNLLLTVDQQLLSNSTVTADELVSIMYRLISQVAFTLFEGENGSGDGAGSKLGSHIASVGIGCPGHVKNGVLVAASNLPLLNDAPLASKLSARLDGIPVVLVNDADAAVAAEVWSKETRAAYRDFENVAMITLGTGIGLGLVLNRRLYSGSNGLVEGGHMIVPSCEEGGAARQCGCGQVNCVETFASAKSLGVRFSEMSGSDVDAKAAFHEAANGNLDAERALDDAAKSLAVLVINICRIVDPDMIVFGGGMSQAGDKLLHRVRSHVKKLSWSVLPTFVKLDIAKSSVNAGLIGAALAGKHDRAVSPSGGDTSTTLNSPVVRTGSFAASLVAAAGMGALLTWLVLVRSRS